MTYILKRMKMAKVAYILGRMEYIFFSQTRMRAIHHYIKKKNKPKIDRYKPP
jgi:hypothetical protein